MNKTWLAALALFTLLRPAPLLAQQPAGDPNASADAAIESRLTRIYAATQWFTGTAVRSDEGVVFLQGSVDSEEHRTWAEDLAKNTDGVAAVVNQLSVRELSIWNLGPVWLELRDLVAGVLRKSPMILLGLILLVVAFFASRWSAQTVRALLRPRLESQLLRNVVSRVIAVPVFLLGLFLVLRLSGLTGLASTLIGGTGLVGLVLGFAFRDIAENFLASLLMSLQNPFSGGDLIQVAGYQGFVRSVNTRSTVLMTLDGNHVQIPNATVYKETITNYTANPNTRFDFAVGVGYDDSLTNAQSVALAVIENHKGVVSDPPPLVLVDALGAATVNLRVYFWVNTRDFSGLRVRSSIIRAVKKAFEGAGISMPDEAREVVFPQGVPIHTMHEAASAPPEPAPAGRAEIAPSHGDGVEAEGDLTTEKDEIDKQAEQAREPEGGANLLKS